MRGEHARSAARRGTATGSSPRARGTPGRHRRKRHVRRFIPACAGNTQRRRAFCHRRAVHPRVRGEHRNNRQEAGFRRGSSPRARGTRNRMDVRPLPFRFIPACAGNTTARARVPRTGAVHPRVRGEHVRAPGPVSPLLGSSPRARGTQMKRSIFTVAARFIPACAGNTSRVRAPLPRGTVHPRVRGEHYKKSLNSMWFGGSSPRARGTLTGRSGCTRQSRFIPACAGNTSDRQRRKVARTVHPRVRGEHLHHRALHHLRAGSSPRARGTPRG